jgi:hypothetical protein
VAKVSITVVVNGQPAVVAINEESPLLVVIPQALEKTGNVGQPPDNWELRDSSGTLLDTHQKVESFRFGTDTKLFLNLKAGVGG